MKKKATKKTFYFMGLFLLFFVFAQAGMAQLPTPWQNQDIGGVGAAGSASESNGTFTINGSGSDIWGNSDEFHYVYQTLEGDGEISARVVSQTNTDAWAKAGVMIRETLDANSAHASCVVTPGNGVSYQRRESTGNSSNSDTHGGINAPHWVKMTRVGNTFTAYHSPDGVTWTEINSVTITMATQVYVGLAVTSHNDGSISTALFDNVKGVLPQPPSDLSAYALSGTSVFLEWTDNAENEDGFEIQRKTGTDGTYEIIDSTLQDITEFTDNTVTSGQTYFYKVRAYNASGNSDFCTEVSITPVAANNLYSYDGGGNWSDATTWTLDATGAAYDNPSALTPVQSDNVFVIGTDVVTVDTDNLNARSVNIDTDATLDLAATNGHQFNTLEGAGTIKLAQGEFPTTVENNFASTGNIVFEGANIYTISNLAQAHNVTLTNTADYIVLGSELVVSGTFALEGGNLKLTDYNLMLSAESQITLTNAGSSQMIFCSGNAALVKLGSEESHFAPFTFPVGTVGNYTPVTLSDLGDAPTFAAESYIALRATGTAHPIIVEPLALRKYWTIASQGIENVDANLMFTYTAGEAIDGDQTQYVPRVYGETTGWVTPGTVTAAGANPFGTTASGGVLDGDWTAGEAAAFEFDGIPSSDEGGLWSDPDTWIGSVPGIGDKAVIAAGATVIIDVDVEVEDVVIEDGATLSFGPDSYTFTVNNDVVMENNSAFNFQWENNGSYFKLLGDFTIGDGATVNFDGDNNHWIQTAFRGTEAQVLNITGATGDIEFGRMKIDNDAGITFNSERDFLLKYSRDHGLYLENGVLTNNAGEKFKITGDRIVRIYDGSIVGTPGYDAAGACILYQDFSVAEKTMGDEIPASGQIRKLWIRPGDDKAVKATQDLTITEQVIFEWGGVLDLDNHSCTISSGQTVYIRDDKSGVINGVFTAPEGGSFGIGMDKDMNDPVEPYISQMMNIFPNDPTMLSYLGMWSNKRGKLVLGKDITVNGKFTMYTNSEPTATDLNKGFVDLNGHTLTLKGEVELGAGRSRIVGGPGSGLIIEGNDPFSGKLVLAQNNEENHTLDLLKIDKPGITVELGDDLIMSGELNLANGTFDNDDKLIIADNATIVKAQGEILFAPQFLGTTNMVYALNENVTTGVEFPQLVGDLSIAGANLALDKAPTMSGTLALQANLILGDFDLTMTENATFDAANTYSAQAMIDCSGNGKLIKHADQTTDLTVVYPVGTATDYSPVSIASLDATITDVASLSVLPVAQKHIQRFQDQVIDRFWEIETQNLTVNSADIEFTYSPTDFADGDETIFEPRRLNNQQIWETPAGNITVGANPFGTDAATELTGDWTAGEPDAFVGVTYYSQATGNWNNADTWNSAPDGTGTNGIPDANTRAEIQNGHTVTVTADGIASKNIKIASGGVLELGTTKDHSIIRIGGTGTLQFTIDTDTDPIIPQTSLEDFTSPDLGGTVAFAGSGNYNLPEQALYHNLVVAGTGIKTTSADITINGDLDIENNGTFANTAHTLTLTGEANLISSSATSLTLENVAVSGQYIANVDELTLTGNALTGSGTIYTDDNRTINMQVPSASITLDATAAGSTVLYNAAQSQQTANGVYENLTIDNSYGVSLSGNVQVNNTLTLTAGALSLGEFDLTLAATANPVAGTFDANAMIHTNGSGMLVKTLADPAAANLLFPVGTETNYSPVEVENLTATGSGTLAARAVGRASDFIGDPAQALSKHWILESDGITLTNADLFVEYTDDEVNGDENAYAPGKWDMGTGSWAIPSTSVFDAASNRIGATAMIELTGEYTAGVNPDAFQGQPIVSAQSGKWKDASTWVGGTVPDATRDVYIMPGHQVRTDDQTGACKNMVIKAGGEFDAKDENFTVNQTLHVYGKFEDSNNNATTKLLGKVIVYQGGEFKTTSVGSSDRMQFHGGIENYGTFNADDSRFYATQEISGDSPLIFNGYQGIQDDVVLTISNTSYVQFKNRFNGTNSNSTVLLTGGTTVRYSEHDAPMSTGILTCSETEESTFNYNRSDRQYIAPGQYYNLVFSNPGQNQKRTDNGDVHVLNDFVIEDGMNFDFYNPSNYVVDGDMIVGENAQVNRDRNDHTLTINGNLYVDGRFDIREYGNDDVVFTFNGNEISGDASYMNFGNTTFGNAGDVLYDIDCKTSWGGTITFNCASFNAPTGLIETQSQLTFGGTCPDIQINNYKFGTGYVEYNTVLEQDLTINGDITFEVRREENVIELNGHTLTLGGDIIYEREGSIYGSATSGLVLKGAGDYTDELRFYGDKNLASLTIDRENGTARFSDAVTVHNELNLLNGNLSATLSLQAGTNVFRTHGELTNVPGLSGAINVTYGAALASSVELPNTDEHLNNFTIDAAPGDVITLTDNAIVNGNLTLNNGDITLGENNLEVFGTLSGGGENSKIICDQQGRLIKYAGQKSDFVALYPLASENDYTPFEITALNAVVDGMGSIAFGVADQTHPQAVGAITNDYLSRYFIVETDNIYQMAMGVSFAYTDDDVEGDEANLRPAVYNDDWTYAYEFNADAASNTVQGYALRSGGAVTAGLNLGADQMPAECPAPENLSAANLTAASADLAWEIADTNATPNFVINFRESGASDWTEVYAAQLNPYSLGDLLENTQYEWKVRSECGSGFTPASGFSSQANFSTTETFDIPTALDTVNIATNSIDLLWNAVSGATDYTVQYRVLPAGGWVTQSLGNTNTTLALSELPENSEFEFRVSAKGGDNQVSPFSDPFMFFTFPDAMQGRTLVITEEMVVPTYMDFDSVIVENGGIAILESDITVNEAFIVNDGGAVYIDGFHIAGENADFKLKQGGTIRYASRYLRKSDQLTNSAVQVGGELEVKDGSSFIFNGSGVTNDTRQEFQDFFPEFRDFIVEGPGVVFDNNKRTLVVHRALIINGGRFEAYHNGVEIECDSVVNNSIPKAIWSDHDVVVSAGEVKFYGNPTHFRKLRSDNRRMVLHTDITIDELRLRYDDARVELNGHHLTIDYFRQADGQILAENAGGTVSILTESHGNYTIPFGNGTDLLPVKFSLLAGEVDDYTSVSISMNAQVHPQALNGAATNYLNRYISIASDIPGVDMNVSMQYSENDVTGYEYKLENTLYANGEWIPSYDRVNTVDNMVEWIGLTQEADLTAGKHLGYAVPPCPMPEELAAGDITSQSAQLSWTNIPEGVENYTLQYMEDGASDWTSVEISENNHTLESLNLSTQYHWQVNSVCAEGYEPTSEIVQGESFITLDGTCDPAVNLTTDEIGETSVALSWSGGTPDYTVEIRRDDQTWAEAQLHSETGTEILIENLERYTTYVVRVLSDCGSYSDELSFNTLIPGWDAQTNILYVSTEMDIPTNRTFYSIYVQEGGIATLTNDVTVEREFVVEKGGILYCETYAIYGMAFALKEDGYLGLGSPDGIDADENKGNIRTALRTFSSKGYYIYNGTTDQQVGDASPSGIRGLIIDKPNETFVQLNGKQGIWGLLHIKQGYLKTQHPRNHLAGDLINDFAPDAISLYSDKSLQIDGETYIKGEYPTILHSAGIGSVNVRLEQDLELQSYGSYHSARGFIHLNGHKLTLAADQDGTGVTQINISGGGTIAQRFDAASVGTTKSYEFYQNNTSHLDFTLNSTTSTEGVVNFKVVERSHPQRGGALNFVRRYVSINGDLQDINYDVTMKYRTGETQGDATTWLSGLYHDDAWDYTHGGAAGVDVANQNVSLAGETNYGDLSAGFDFALPAQACEMPTNVAVESVDYQGAVLNWTVPADGAEDFIVWYRPTETTADWSETSSGGAGATFGLNDLAPDTEYEFMVKTVCEAGFEGESDFALVDTFATEPLKACDFPDGLTAEDITSGSVDLSWGYVDGNTDYVIQIKPTEAFDWQTLYDAGSATQYYLLNLFPDMQYEWRVKTNCGAGYHPASEYAPADTFMTTPPCDIASDLSTENIYYYGAEFHWTPVDNLNSQTIRYRQTETTAWEAVPGLDATQDAYTELDAELLSDDNALLPETGYEWQIRSYCANSGISPYSPSVEFTTTPEPVCETPAGFYTTNISTSTATINWASGNGTADDVSYNVAYRIQGDEDWTYEYDITGYHFDLTALPPGTVYEWMVSTNCDAVTGAPWSGSDFSEIQTFKTYMICDETPQNMSSNSPNWCFVKLDWDPVFGITNYQIRYRQTGVTEWIEKTLGDRDSATVYSLEGDTEYEWELRTYCFGTETYSDWSEADTFRTAINDGSPCGGPTDNPYATFYGQAPDWTYDLAWDNIVNIQSFDDGSGYWDNAVMDAQMALAGPGVVYFPEGTYNFQNHVQLLDGVVLRGATPVNTNAKSPDFAPPSRLVFPKYEPLLEGEGTPNHTAFKSIVSPSLRSNTGLVYLDINRGHIGLKVPLVDMPGYSTPQPVGEKTNVIVFGIRSNNVATPSPDVPKTWEDEGVSQHAWQRFSYRFGVNISVYVTANGVVANCRVNDFEENNVHPITDDGYDQPGYLAAGTYNGSVEMPSGASNDGFTTIQYGERARFSYTDHYGIEVNRGKPYQTFGTPEVEPSLYAPGIEILDNWIYTTRRVGIMGSGQGLVIRGNIKKDLFGKRAFLDLLGVKLQGNNSATYENRGIDWSGHDVTVADNYLEVARTAILYSGYLSVDGEGILIQECCGGSSVDGVSITGNTLNAYIGIYKMRDIKDVYIADNTFYSSPSGGVGSIFVSSDTNGGEYRSDNVRIENNHNCSSINFQSSVGACNSYIVNNDGTGGNINAPCLTIVYGNQGLNYNNSECPPEPDCSMPPPPEITSFEPMEGAVNYPVDIYGSGFIGTDSVVFNNTAVTDFQVIDDGHIKTKVPQGATTGKITVYSENAQWDGSTYVFPTFDISDDDFVIGQGVQDISFAPAGGVFDTAQAVTITTPTDGAAIYYTTDGTMPEEGAGTSQEYTEPIVVDANTTIKAKAFKTDMYPSLVDSAEYIIQLITADFDATIVELGQETEFYNLSTVTTGSITKVRWDFDNDQSTDAVGDTVQYTFDSGGFHDVTITVKTNYGFERSVTKQVEVTEDNSIHEVGDVFDLLKVYPNPTKGALFINLSSQNTGQVQVRVLDALGRVVKIKQYEKHTEHLREKLDIEDLSPGVYMLEIEQGKQRAVKRVMKN